MKGQFIGCIVLVMLFGAQVTFADTTTVPPTAGDKNDGTFVSPPSTPPSIPTGTTTTATTPNTAAGTANTSSSTTPTANTSNVSSTSNQMVGDANDSTTAPPAATSTTTPADTSVNDAETKKFERQNAAIANGGATTPSSGNGSKSSGVKVRVTEKIPGADCTQITKSGSGVTTRQYECVVQGGFYTVQKMLGGLIKYATFLTAILGVLMIVLSGLQYATSAGDTKMQTAAVHRITKLVGGLVLLFLIALILNTVAPWVYG